MLTIKVSTLLLTHEMKSVVGISDPCEGKKEAQRGFETGEGVLKPYILFTFFLFLLLPLFLLFPRHILLFFLVSVEFFLIFFLIFFYIFFSLFLFVLFLFSSFHSFLFFLFVFDLFFLLLAYFLVLISFFLVFSYLGTHPSYA